MAPAKKSWFKRKRGNNANATKPKSRRQRSLTTGTIEDSTINDESSDEGQAAAKKVRWGTVEEEEEEDGATATQDDETTTEEIQITNDKIVLAVFCQHYRIGCAYYDPVKLVMYVLEDTAESSHFDITKLLLEQVDPDFALTSTRADEASIDVMRDFTKSVEASGNPFQIRPAKDFIPGKGRDRLLSLKLLSELPVDTEDMPSSHSMSGDEPTNAYDFMKKRRNMTGDPSMQKWNASIRVGNFASLDNSPLCAASIGALLDHLSRVRVMSSFDNDDVDGLEVRSIEALSLEQFMQINADALSSLRVFDTESHASIHSDKTKEGLSLFGILDSTRTSLGRILLRQWLLRPSLSLDVINSRHDAVECLSKAENIVTAATMHNHLKGLKNIPRIMKLLKTGKTGLYDWEGLVKFTFHAALLKECLSELSNTAEIDIVSKLVEVLDVASFRELGNTIHTTIDWEESAISARVCVRPNIDEELDQWKHIYNGIDGVLSRIAEQICEIVPSDYTSSLNVVYFPQLGFLICVPMQESWTTEKGIDVLDGWTFQFSSESHVYFKSEQMNDMDRHIGDLHPAIVDREIEIIQRLSEKVIVYDEAIMRACEACAELDCLLCFADASRAFNYRRPEMVQENVIHIVQGRHPLQEQVVDTFIPNDVFIRGGMGLDVFPAGAEEMSDVGPDLGNAKSVLILTGANACGKSVYLKQTALIQYMAQIGCFVPAESATLGIVDKIFTRVQTKESVSKAQSAFMIDLNQVSLALRNCTARSLILLDEFGKGTISTALSTTLLTNTNSWGYLTGTDGAGLFCGVLKHLLARGTECPKVVSATHFHELFHDELLSTALPIDFFHMQILIPDDVGTKYDHNSEQTEGEMRLRNEDEEKEHREEEHTKAHLRLLRGETITYLYRVAPGLSLESHAARCAQMFGLPPRIVQRAQHVTNLLSTHNVTCLLDEAMTPTEISELEAAEAVCRRFLEWDLDSFDCGSPGAVKARLAEVLGIKEEKDVDG